MMSLTHLMNLDGANEPSTNATPASLPTQPTDSVTEAAQVRRKIGVGRREIRTTAEACFQKANVSVPSALTGNKPLPRVQVVIESSRADGGDASVETSAPGSVHDSADDESELSELEEGDDLNSSPPAKTERRPMFPGLASQLESREASEGFDTADEEPAVEDVDVEMVEMRDRSTHDEQRSTGWGVNRASQLQANGGVEDVES